ncbi:type II toxin-antitoxin system prevent-host-death family antitoxin [Dehalococcoidia bacterium]|nr:type II toxin-antitoxin system prevent-host-death family antitoxin [Dehalococcoidia bacterium]
MHEVRLKEAKVRLAELIDEAAYGEEVVITKYTYVSLVYRW